MKIDNRVFIPIVTPFVLYLWVWVFFAFVGVPLDLSPNDVGLLITLTGFIGICIMVACFEFKIYIGSIGIKSAREDSAKD